MQLSKDDIRQILQWAEGQGGIKIKEGGFTALEKLDLIKRLIRAGGLEEHFSEWRDGESCSGQ